jgi:16S rRNA (uracil1498-N3)-methyltransferase
MTRIFIDSLSSDFELSSQELVELSPDLTHHLRDVLRLVVGNQITVVVRENSQEYLAIIASVNKDGPVKVQLLKPSDRVLPIPIVSTLACGLPKGSHADQICEQVAQLGIEQIVFWGADRSVAQPKQADSKLERWQKIAEAAARQSKQNSIPKVFYFSTSTDFFSWLRSRYVASEDLLAVCSLKPEAQSIAAIRSPVGRAFLLVGPEGDFSPQEIKSLDDLGASHISLGPLVLRVETAAVVSVAMGLAIWGWRKEGFG